MGTILQERVPQQCLDRVFIRDREWRRKASWSNSGPNVASISSNKMGRRQSQRRSLQPQFMSPRQESKNEKRVQQKRKHKSNTPSTKPNSSQHSAQGTSRTKPSLLSTDRMETHVQPAAQSRETKHRGLSGRRHTPAFPCYSLKDSCPEMLEGLSPSPGVGRYQEDSDSDTDLSESERLPASPSGRAPPQLELRPEVIEDSSTCSHRPRRGHHGGFDFADFLPPPFNSWNLSQLSMFYNTEGHGTPRPRPVGPLERYLERLLQLEWCQIQSSVEENGKSTVPDGSSSCRRSPAATSSRLSTPKCILQCQRAFPLTFLSSLASHSALLSGCACTLCRIRYSSSFKSCCGSSHGHTRQSRLSPVLDRRRPASPPKRSYSESRVHSSDKSSILQAQRFSSPVRTTSYLKRMQASGNLRNSIQGANTKLHSYARDFTSGVGKDHLGTRGDMLDHRTGVFRGRSGSEQRRGGTERLSSRRSGSEQRRGGAERKAVELKEREIKPDAVTAIMDNLPGSTNAPINRPNRVKQVEFVT